MSTVNRNKRYDAELEKGIVSMVLDDRRSINQICKEFQISKNTVGKWLKLITNGIVELRIQHQYLTQEFYHLPF